MKNHKQNLASRLIEDNKGNVNLSGKTSKITITVDKNEFDNFTNLVKTLKGKTKQEIAYIALKESGILDNNDSNITK